jgi:hypothetical protein
MGVNALKVQLGGDRKEAQEFYNAYLETFSGLADWLRLESSSGADQCHSFCHWHSSLISVIAPPSGKVNETFTQYVKAVFRLQNGKKAQPSCFEARGRP